MSGVDPSFGWQALLFVIGGLTIWKMVTDIQARRNSQDVAVSFKTTYATKEELRSALEAQRKHEERMAVELRRIEDRHIEEFAQLRQEMREDKSELMQASEERVKVLHNRSNDILAVLSELRGEMHARRDK